MEKYMKAAVMESLGQFAIREVPMPKFTDEDILIKVDACGICGSDIRILYNGNKRVKYPQIFGHEIAGTVAEVGKYQEAKFKVGDRIALSADIPCGNCEWCKEDLKNHCENNIAFGHEYQGGFAEYLALNKRIIDYGPMVKVAETDITQDELSMSEPLACCINGVELCNIKKGSNVLIFGAGPVGCILVKLAKTIGASNVVLCDVDAARLKAAEVAMADSYVIPTQEELMKVYDSITRRRGFDAIITACPSMEAQESALKYIKAKGTINFFGGLPNSDRVLSLNSNYIHYNEVSVLGSHGSTPEHHRKAVDMILNRNICLEDLISKRFRLEDMHIAIEEARDNKNNLKIIINP